MPTRCARRQRNRRVALFSDADERHGASGDGMPGEYQQSFVEYEFRVAAAREQRRRRGARAAAVHFLVRPRHDDQRALGNEAGLDKRLERFEKCDQRALVIDRAAAPNRAVGELAAEGRVVPARLTAGRHRYDVLVGHEDHRREARRAAGPRVDERAAIDELAAKRRMRRRVARLEPVVQPVPLAAFVLGRILVRHGAKLHRLAEMPGGKRQREGRGGRQRPCIEQRGGL